MQAANSVPEIKKMFGTMGNIWKLFFYSPKKAVSLKAVQSVLKLPELKIVKPSDTRWLSHERSVRPIYRELPALIVTLQQLYETSGDAEAYGIGALLATYIGVASIMFLSEVLVILPILLKMTTDQLDHLKDERSEWLGLVESEISLLKEKYDITLGTHGSARSSWSSITTTAEYRTLVAIPYVDSLLLNIKSRFTDKAMKIGTAMSIFSPSLLPAEASLPSYGSEKIKILAEFYGKEAAVEYALTTYTSPPLLDGDELLSEWKIFRRALLVEKKAIMERKEESASPSMQEILDEMNKSHTYGGIFPETWKLLNITMALPVGTATVERSFSQMKLIITRLRSRLSDSNLEHLMKIRIKGPPLTDVDFNAILDIFKQKNRRILL